MYRETEWERKRERGIERMRDGYKQSDIKRKKQCDNKAVLSKTNP